MSRSPLPQAAAPMNRPSLLSGLQPPFGGTEHRVIRSERIIQAIIFGLPLREASSLPTEEEPGEVQRRDSLENETHQRNELGGDCRPPQSHVAWLVRVLPTCLADDLPRTRWLGPRPTAERAPQTARSPRSRSRHGSSPLAEQILCQARAVQPDDRPCSGRSILSQVRPSTGEPDAGNPPVRFGGRGD